MEPLHRIADDLLETARGEENGRAARLLVHDGPLRQTLVALLEGRPADLPYELIKYD